MSEGFKQKADSGAMFRQLSKKHPKAPDYSGEIAIDLKDMTAVTQVDGLHVFKLSGWQRETAAGKKYMSLAVSRFVPDGRSSNPAPARPVQKQEDDEF